MRNIVISFGSPWSVAGALALVVWVYAMALPAGSAAGPPDLRVATRDGAPIKLETEELRGPSALPLLATRDRLHEQFRKAFIWFYKARIADGTAVVGRWVVDRGPLRLTMYEITKNATTPRWLRVIGTRVYREGETAEFRSDLRKFAEHVYLVTAEAVTTPDQLNAHLRFMSTQGDAILLQGYSTNWNMSTLRLRMVEKGAGGDKDAEFAKDADWLVSHLIDPQWVVSIRLE